MKNEIFIKMPSGFDLNSIMQQAQQMQEQRGREVKEMKVDVSVVMQRGFEVL